MKPSHIKLIASDLDGTLLNSSGELNAEFFPLFEQLEQKGVRFAIATGRQYYNVVKNFQPVADRLFCIAENGTYVMHRGEELLVNDIPLDEIRQMIEHGRKLNNICMVLCGKRSAYMEPTDTIFAGEAHKYYQRLALVDDLMDVADDQFLKLAICDPQGASSYSLSHFQPWSATHKVTVSGPYWLDVMHKESNKGMALAMLQQHLGVTPEETMVFGDHLNDSEMIRQAYHSYAMENAEEEIRAAARFIAPSNDHNGVIQTIKEWLVVSGR